MWGCRVQHFCFVVRISTARHDTLKYVIQKSPLVSHVVSDLTLRSGRNIFLAGEEAGVADGWYSAFCQRVSLAKKFSDHCNQLLRMK
jgi:hypothetical protein